MSRADALALCRGRYQRALIEGTEAWSGASLRGSARDWAASYARSRRSLLKRIEDAGIGYLTIGDGGKFVLCYGRPPGYYVKRRISCGTAWVPGPKTVLDDVVEALDEA